jgi:hypothetical protein
MNVMLKQNLRRNPCAVRGNVQDGHRTSYELNVPDDHRGLDGHHVKMSVQDGLRMNHDLGGLAHHHGNYVLDDHRATLNEPGDHRNYGLGGRHVKTNELDGLVHHHGKNVQDGHHVRMNELDDHRKNHELDGLAHHHGNYVLNDHHVKMNAQDDHHVIHELNG